MWAEDLLRLQGQQPKGPSPSFSPCHLVLTIIALGRGYVGRKKLAEELGVGEGAIRTIIGRLKTAGLLTTVASGCTLTERGAKLYRDMAAEIEIFDADGLAPVPGPVVGVRLHGLAHLVQKGLEERDSAVRAGANGAMILTYVGGHFTMPGLTDISSEHPELASGLESSLRMHEGDVVIIAWASSRSIAKCSAVSACMNLLEKASN